MYSIGLGAVWMRDLCSGSSEALLVTSRCWYAARCWVAQILKSQGAIVGEQYQLISFFRSGSDDKVDDKEIGWLEAELERQEGCKRNELLVQEKDAEGFRASVAEVEHDTAA